MRKTDVKELLDNTAVQDPTDFPPSSTVPGLRALDSALRCNICQELYEAPVVLTCGHCFCSLVRVMITASARLYHWSASCSVRAANSVRNQRVQPAGKKPPPAASGSTRRWQKLLQPGKMQGTSLVAAR